MLKIKKSKKAEIDIEIIWQTSFKHWGEKQADRYYDSLATAINDLTRNPEIGKNFDDIKIGYRSLRIKKHAIYYKISKQEIMIIRVLHERMLAEKHL